MSLPLSEQSLEQMALIVCLSVSGWVGWVGCALSGGHCALRLLRPATDPSTSWTLLWPALTRRLSQLPSPVTCQGVSHRFALRSAQPAACAARAPATVTTVTTATFHARCLPCAFHAPSLRSQETARNHGVLMLKPLEVFVVLSTY